MVVSQNGETIMATARETRTRKPNGNAPTGIMSAIAAAQAQHEAEAAGKQLTLAEKATRFMRECRDSLSETTRTRVSPLVRTLDGSQVRVSGKVPRGRAFCRATASWSSGVLKKMAIFLDDMDKSTPETITAIVQTVAGEEVVSHYDLTYDIAPNQEIGTKFHPLSETGVPLADFEARSFTVRVKAHIDENGREVIPIVDVGTILAAGRSLRTYAGYRGF
jgi:hypothetical protein